MASPPQPLGAAEGTARAVITQTLLDFHAASQNILGASQQLLALNLEQTRQWLALGTNVVDEDVRRRGIMHKAIKDLDIADRSIAVLEFQKHAAKWAPAPAPQPAVNDQDGAGIVNLIGAGVKQLLDKKN